MMCVAPYLLVVAALAQLKDDEEFIAASWCRTR